MPIPTLTEIVFYGAAGLAVMSALMVITMKNAVRSALFLVLTMFAIAILYVLLNAQFIAAVQIIVYAGAVMVLFIFVIMLIDSGDTLEGFRNPIRKIFGGLFGAMLLAQIVLIAYVAKITESVKGVDTAEKIAQIGGNTEAIGHMLFSKYVFPFEVISILLLVAIIGSVVLAKRKL